MDPRLLVDFGVLRRLGNSPTRAYIAALEHAAQHGGHFDMTALELAESAHVAERTAATVLRELRELGVLVFDSSSKRSRGRRLPSQRVRTPLVRVGQGDTAVDIHEEDI